MWTAPRQRPLLSVLQRTLERIQQQMNDVKVPVNHTLIEAVTTEITMSLSLFRFAVVMTIRTTSCRITAFDASEIAGAVVYTMATIEETHALLQHSVFMKRTDGLWNPGNEDTPEPCIISKRPLHDKLILNFS